jgi:hypothetical protein
MRESSFFDILWAPRVGLFQPYRIIILQSLLGVHRNEWRF